MRPLRKHARSQVTNASVIPLSRRAASSSIKISIQSTRWLVSFVLWMCFCFALQSQSQYVEHKARSSVPAHFSMDKRASKRRVRRPHENFLGKEMKYRSPNIEDRVFPQHNPNVLVGAEEFLEKYHFHFQSEFTRSQNDLAQLRTNATNMPPWCSVKQQKEWENSDLVINKKEPVPKGILLAKLFKTASSTAASVTMRLARRIAQRHGAPYGKRCESMFVHEKSLSGVMTKRDLTSSFLWTTIRHPTSRAWSAYQYYMVSMLGIRPTLESAKTYFDSVKDTMVQQLRNDRPHISEAFGVLLPRGGYGQILGGVDPKVYSNSSEGLAAWMQRHVVKEYNFIGIAERMNESLIVLLFLMGLLPAENEEHVISDIVVLSSKNTNIVENWLLEAKIDKRLEKIKPVIRQENIKIPSSVCLNTSRARDDVHKLRMDPATSAMQNDFERGNLDHVFYNNINRVLDQTIQNLIGKDQMQRWLEILQSSQLQATSKCHDKAHFPCQESNQDRVDPAANSNCYFRDMGCGYRCVDKLFPISSATSPGGRKLPCSACK